MTITKPYITHYRAQKAKIALQSLITHSDENGDTETLALATGALAKIDMILRATTVAITALPASHTLAGEYETKEVDVA